MSGRATVSNPIRSPAPRGAIHTDTNATPNIATDSELMPRQRQRPALENLRHDDGAGQQHRPGDQRPYRDRPGALHSAGARHRRQRPFAGQPDGRPDHREDSADGPRDRTDDDQARREVRSRWCRRTRPAWTARTGPRDTSRAETRWAPPAAHRTRPPRHLRRACRRTTSTGLAPIAPMVPITARRSSTASRIVFMAIRKPIRTPATAIRLRLFAPFARMAGWCGRGGPAVATPAMTRSISAMMSTPGLGRTNALVT